MDDARWETVAGSTAVPAGAVVDAHAGGLELVVWRRSDGQPVVMDARCPHQWSHLGAEGVLDGDELVCTTHCWRFAADGTGTKLNVKGRRDDKAGIATFPTRERDGVIEALLPGR